ncbi:MAG: glycerate kinase [Actinomycetaceae bacterium]|nr:glycerate kinase [Actinomycetaceae bacterium]
MSDAPPKIVIACDKFKGSLSATDVAEVIEKAVCSFNADMVVSSFVIADGGDGTLDALEKSGMSSYPITVSGPTGGEHESSYLFDGSTAVVELADTCGIVHLPEGKLQPLKSSTYGLGQAIRAALSCCPRQLIIGVGGSASSDGGMGMLQALGARFFNAEGFPLPPEGASLSQIACIDLSQLDPQIKKTKIILASDVDNELLGPNGAVAVYGPQKGAVGAIAEELEHGLEVWSRFIEEIFGAGYASREGAGAAGGVGFAAMAVLGASMRPGIELVLELSGIEKELKDASLVITGEGKLDAQTLMGKAVAGVTKAAAAHNVDVVAVCGHSELSPHEVSELGLKDVYAITDIEPDTDIAMKDAAKLLKMLCKNKLKKYVEAACQSQ